MFLQIFLLQPEGNYIVILTFYDVRNLSSIQRLSAPVFLQPTFYYIRHRDQLIVVFF